MGLAKNLLAKAVAVVAPKPTDIRSYVRSNEGKRLMCYDDKTGKTLQEDSVPEGKPTIGIGHTGPEVVPGLQWTDAQVEQAYNHDLVTAQHNVCVVFGGFRWTSLDEVRKAALADMAFNLGREGLSKFRDLIRAVCGSNWDAAHDAIANSLYAKELPKRAARNAEMLLFGEWI